MCTTTIYLHVDIIVYELRVFIFHSKHNFLILVVVAEGTARVTSGRSCPTLAVCFQTVAVLVLDF